MEYFSYTHCGIHGNATVYILSKNALEADKEARSLQESVLIPKFGPDSKGDPEIFPISGEEYWYHRLYSKDPSLFFIS